VIDLNEFVVTGLVNDSDRPSEIHRFQADLCEYNPHMHLIDFLCLQPPASVFVVIRFDK
jgi:hypothetical protein